MVYFMKIRLNCARLAALPVTLAASLSTFAQTSLPLLPSLPETKVTAPRFLETASTLAFGVSVINATEIKNAGITTVNEAIAKLLGVPARLDFFGSGNSTLDLRGFGPTANSNQVVILDGVRLSEADLSNPWLSGISIESVDRIEVLRGNAAVLYGEGATGGAIVITTRSGNRVVRPNSAQLTAAAGSNGQRDASASATVSGSGFSLDVTANQRKTNNHRDNFKSTTDGLTATAQWQNDWLRLGLRHGRDSLQSGLPGALTAAQYSANPKQTLNPSDSGNVKNERTGAFAQANVGDWQIALDVAKRVKRYSSTQSGFTFDFDIDASTTGLRARHENTEDTFANTTVFGYDHSAWQRQIPGMFGSVSKATSSAFYVKNDVTVLDAGTRLSFGVRQEALRKDLSSPATELQSRQRAWDLGVVQPLPANTAVFARVGSSFRLANADEFSFTLPGTSLSPQTSQDKEIGLRFEDAATKAELRLYRSDITKEIGFDPAIANSNSFNGIGANVNFDPIRRQGIEVEVKHSLNPNIDVRANAALRSATFRSGVYAGKDVPLTPRQSLALRGDWRFAQQQQISAGLQWTGAQRPDFANACTMPAYAVLDGRYAYRFANAELAVGASNLTNRKYFSQAFQCIAGVTNGIYPDAGRAVTVTLRLDF